MSLDQNNNEYVQDCPVISAYCDHYAYQRDSCGDIAIDHCCHEENPSDFEGNCTEFNCPLI